MADIDEIGRIVIEQAIDEVGNIVYGQTVNDVGLIVPLILREAQANRTLSDVLNVGDRDGDQKVCD